MWLQQYRIQPRRAQSLQLKVESLSMHVRAVLARKTAVLVPRSSLVDDLA